MSDTTISVRNLYKVFGDDPANAMKLVRDGVSKGELLERTGHVIGLSDINMQIERRQIQVVMGLSGSGKSTLIRHLNRLIDPTEGEIEIDGQDIMAYGEKDLLKFRRHNISMVFQRFALFPHRTVLENIGFGLGTQQRPKDEIKNRALRWIDRVGLSGYEDYFPSQLSGGMQQRVGLARALATDAEILLMDEPASALDPISTLSIEDLIRELREQYTIVVVTHNMQQAGRLSDYTAQMWTDERRQGTLIEYASTRDLFSTPHDSRTEGYITGRFG